jgi:hypothetical protein
LIVAGRPCLYLCDVADAYAALVDAVSRERGGDLYVEVDEAAAQVRDLLTARGFAVQRHEHAAAGRTGPRKAAGRAFLGRPEARHLCGVVAVSGLSVTDNVINGQMDACFMCGA